jgi:hypothetical protein
MEVTIGELLEAVFAMQSRMKLCKESPDRVFVSHGLEVRNVSWSHVLVVRQVPAGKNLHAICFHAGFFLGLFFDPEDGVDMFL